MSAVPRAVLSEYFQEMVAGKTVLGGVFLTYQFDPGFFEQEVLPVFLDLGLSHAPPIRLVQIEEALRAVPHGIAVYYDVNGLDVARSGSAKLDIGRYPVSVRTGVFHPKNILLLLQDAPTEATDPDGEVSPPTKHLLVACMSANLTRAGWWRNVECCHAELLEENGRNAMRDDLLDFARKVRRLAGGVEDHRALDAVVEFLRGTEQRTWRKDSDDLYHTRFYGGGESVAEFLGRVTGNDLGGSCMDVISPYFDDASECRPLQDLVDRLDPSEVRVFLPRTPAGDAACSKETHAAIRGMDCVRWARMPADVLRLSGREGAKERFVHAKVYRFFNPKSKGETFFIGSVNLTSAAHSGRGNVESGFLFNHAPGRGQDFWLSLDERLPVKFDDSQGGEERDTVPGSRLRLVYDWSGHIARGFWDDATGSAAMTVSAAGDVLGSVGPLASRAWSDLGPTFADILRDTLRSTSFLRVDEGGKTLALLLVQETGMAKRPSVLLDLSIADILRYWSMLSVEQRAAFLDARASAGSSDGGSGEVPPNILGVREEETFFDRFAGFFHAFTCLERLVRKELDGGNVRAAECRLFGAKYDSLGAVVRLVLAGKQMNDDLDRYVVLRCVGQLLRETGRDYPDFEAGHRADFKGLQTAMAPVSEIRERIIGRNEGDMREFVDWFDAQFLRRATPLEAST